MSDLWSEDLKLNLIASDEASSVLQVMSDTVSKLVDQIDEIGTLDPFAKIQEDADTLDGSLSGIAGTFKTMTEAFSKSIPSPFGTIKEAISTLTTDLDNSVTSFKDLQTTIDGFKPPDVMSGIDGYVNSFSEDAGKATDAFSRLGDTISKFKPKDVMSGITGNVTDFTIDVNDATDAFDELAKTISQFKPKNTLAAITGDIVKFGDDIQTATTYWESMGKAINGFAIKENPFNALNGWLNTTISKLDEAVALVDKLSGKHATVNIGGFVGGGESVPTAGSMDTQALNSMFGTLDSRLETVDATMKTLPSRIAESIKGSGSGTKSSGSGTKSSGSGTSSHGTFDLMGTAFEAMMGYQGLQMLVNGSSQMAQVKNMVEQGMGIKGSYGDNVVNEAGRNLLMLQSNSLGVNDLTSVVGQLQKQFTLSGTSTSAEYKQLASLGVTKDQIMGGESPWAILNSLHSDYQRLSNDPAKQALLLSDTGTSQFQNLFNNWGAYQQSASGVNLGLNSAQLASSVQEDAKGQTGLARLTLEFDQLANSMMPVVNAFTNMLNPFDKFVSWVQEISNNPLVKTGMKFANPFNVATGALQYVDDLIKSLNKSWPSFTAAFGRDIGALWDDGVKNPLDSFKYNVIAHFDDMAAEVEQILNRVSFGHLVPSSIVQSTQQAAEINAFKAQWLANPTVNSMPQGNNASVSVNHNGTVNVNFTGNMKGISSMDKQTLRELAQELSSQIFTTHKIAYSADVSF